MAGYIESWGRGIEIMLERCKEYNIPEPVIAEEQGGLSVTFLKDIYTSDYLQTLNLNERQIKGVLYAKEKGSIKNAEYQEINELGRTVAAEELQDLANRRILQKVGTTGRSAKYILSNRVE
jgi:ATP-dependent DNA helicase RecG